MFSPSLWDNSFPVFEAPLEFGAAVEADMPEVDAALEEVDAALEFVNGEVEQEAPEGARMIDSGNNLLEMRGGRWVYTLTGREAANQEAANELYRLVAKSAASTPGAETGPPEGTMRIYETGGRSFGNSRTYLATLRNGVWELQLISEVRNGVRVPPGDPIVLPADQPNSIQQDLNSLWLDSNPQANPGYWQPFNPPEGATVTDSTGRRWVRRRDSAWMDPKTGEVADVDSVGKTLTRQWQYENTPRRIFQDVAPPRHGQPPSEPPTGPPTEPPPGPPEDMPAPRGGAPRTGRGGNTLPSRGGKAPANPPKPGGASTISRVAGGARVAAGLALEGWNLAGLVLLYRDWLMSMVDDLDFCYAYMARVVPAFEKNRQKFRQLLSYYQAQQERLNGVIASCTGRATRDQAIYLATMRQNLEGAIEEITRRIGLADDAWREFQSVNCFNRINAGRYSLITSVEAEARSQQSRYIDGVNNLVAWIPAIDDAAANACPGLPPFVDTRGLPTVGGTVTDQEDEELDDADEEPEPATPIVYASDLPEPGPVVPSPGPMVPGAAIVARAMALDLPSETVRGATSRIVPVSELPNPGRAVFYPYPITSPKLTGPVIPVNKLPMPMPGQPTFYPDPRPIASPNQIDPASWSNVRFGAAADSSMAFRPAPSVIPVNKLPMPGQPTFYPDPHPIASPNQQVDPECWSNVRLGAAAGYSPPYCATTPRWTPRSSDIDKTWPSVCPEDWQPWNNGWTPKLAVATDGDRRVLQVVGWTGGTGTPPSAPKYVGIGGYVTIIGDAEDIRGTPGDDGAPGVVTATAPIAYDSGTQTVSTSVASGKLIGRHAAGTGVMQEVVLGSTLAFSSGTLQTGAGTGHVTWSANSFANTIANGVVTLGMWASGVLDTDGTLTANSDAKVPSQKAVKTYVDGIVAANDTMVFKGVIDCSGNPNYPAADRGWTYRVSVAGKIGGGSGPNVEAGDTLLCLDDGTASGNQATVGSHWGIIQSNLDGAVIGPASATDNGFVLFNGTTGKVVKDATFVTVPVSKGGTGLTAGTSGGVLGYTASGTLASSAALAANGVVLGGGAGATPTATAAGSAYQPLRVPSGGGAPAFGAIDLSQSAAVTGALAIGNGGTGQTTANAALNALLPSQTSANHKTLHSDGTNTSWSLVVLSTDVSGTLPVASGGTGQTTASAAFDALSPMTTLGDVTYGGTSGTGTRLAGNTTSTKKLLTQTGTGTVSAAPTWDTLSAILDAILGSTQGSVIYRGASAWAALGPGSAGDVLKSGGAGANPSWVTPVTKTFWTGISSMTIDGCEISVTPTTDTIKGLP